MINSWKTAYRFSIDAAAAAAVIPQFLSRFLFLDVCSMASQPYKCIIIFIIVHSFRLEPFQ